VTEIKSLCVYCGSSPGAKPDYVALSERLAKTMAEQNLGLVYGGAHVGIMGALANRLMDMGGKVVGVIPEALVEMEVAHQGLTELHIVADMHERKATMARLSDGFISLPGGLGTLEEMFEMLTWSQLGLHGKPCGLLNVAGFYDDLLRFLDNACSEKFMLPHHRALLIDSTDPEDLISRMKAYVPEVKSKLDWQLLQK